MTHKTTGRSSRLNHTISRVGVAPTFPRVWQQGPVAGRSPSSAPLSAKAQTEGLSGNECLLGELEEGGHAK
jgi:hypothetical protein